MRRNTPTRGQNEQSNTTPSERSGLVIGSTIAGAAIGLIAAGYSLCLLIVLLSNKTPAREETHSASAVIKDLLPTAYLLVAAVVGGFAGYVKGLEIQARMQVTLGYPSQSTASTFSSGRNNVEVGLGAASALKAAPGDLEAQAEKTFAPGASE